jgi:hypothetical protein
MMEENLRRAMKISLGDQMLLITRPILRRLPVRRRRVARRQHAAGAAGQALRGDAGLSRVAAARRTFARKPANFSESLARFDRLPGDKSEKMPPPVLTLFMDPGKQGICTCLEQKMTPLRSRPSSDSGSYGAIPCFPWNRECREAKTGMNETFQRFRPLKPLMIVEALFSLYLGVFFNVGVDIGVLALFSFPLIKAIRERGQG